MNTYIHVNWCTKNIFRSVSERFTTHIIRGIRLNKIACLHLDHSFLAVPFKYFPRGDKWKHHPTQTHSTHPSSRRGAACNKHTFEEQFSLRPSFVTISAVAKSSLRERNQFLRHIHHCESFCECARARAQKAAQSQKFSSGKVSADAFALYPLLRSRRSNFFMALWY